MAKKNFRKKAKRVAARLRAAGKRTKEVGKAVKEEAEAAVGLYQIGARRVVKEYGRIQRKAREVSKRMPTAGAVVGMPTKDGVAPSAVAQLAGLRPAKAPVKRLPKKKKKEEEKKPYRSPLW